MAIDDEAAKADKPEIEDEPIRVPRWGKKDDQMIRSMMCGAIEICAGVGIVQYCENPAMYVLSVPLFAGGVADMISGRPASLLYGVDALVEKYMKRKKSGGEGNADRS